MVKLRPDPIQAENFSPQFDLKVFAGLRSAIDPEIVSAWERCQLDQFTEYPPPVPVVSIGDQPILTRKSISLFQGKEKSKKTTALLCLVSDMLRPAGFFTDKSDGGKVLWFDTEQGLSYAARTMRTILNKADLEFSDRLVFCDLREFISKERIQIIRHGIESTENVALVIIDGLVDLMADFMDAAEGHQRITELLRLASEEDCHIATVLHQNKADKNARAHIGSIAAQKCEMEIMTELNPANRYESFVSCVKSRGLPFDLFTISWLPGGLPEIVDIGVIEKHSPKLTQARELAESVFTQGPLTFSEALQGLAGATLKSEATAKRALRDLVNWGIVIKNENYYSLKSAGVKSGSKIDHDPRT